MERKTVLACRTSLKSSPIEPPSLSLSMNRNASICYAQLSNGYNLTTISRPVGKGQLNRPLDVLAIQRLFNGSTITYEGQRKLAPDGVYGGQLAAQIAAFQKHVVKMHAPDGIISVNGMTHKHLLSALDPYFTAKHFNASKNNEMYQVDAPHFLKLFKDEFPEEAAHLGNVEILLNYCLNDYRITDIRWVAYMMATVKKETGNWSASREEFGKGAGLLYSKEYTVIDPLTKEEKTVVYYGRGYCQLTWEKNYIKLGKIIGENLDIYPERALEPNISYEILSIGIIEGIITEGKPIGKYINGAKCDYYNARRTINNLDDAQEIAGNALKYEVLLKASQKNAYIKRSAYICF